MMESRWRRSNSGNKSTGPTFSVSRTGGDLQSEDIRLRLTECLPRLRRFAFVLTGNRDSADDVVQETCARALANADKWQAGTRFDSWLYRIAQNIWFDQMRARRRRAETTDTGELSALAGEDGRTVVEGRLMLDIVSRKIGELSDDQQLLIVLVCIDGLSYKEAAEALGIPVGTVMSRLARARIALNAALAPPQATKDPGRERKARK